MRRENAWTEAARRKRRRQFTSPSHGGQSVGQAGANPAGPRQQPNKTVIKPKVKTLVGASATSTLQAAKILQVPKAVFCLSNIDSSYSEGDIKSFVLGLGIRVLTCFELKPSQNRPEGNKSFRLCIIAEDKNKLFNRENWPVGVTLREWQHKPKEDRLTEGGGWWGQGAGGARVGQGVEGGGGRVGQKEGGASSSSQTVSALGHGREDGLGGRSAPHAAGVTDDHGDTMLIEPADPRSSNTGEDVTIK